VESFSRFVKRCVRALNRSGLEYVLTGALAASYYGRPRTTLDLDVLVAFRDENTGRLAKALTSANLRVYKKQLLAAWVSNYRIATIEDKKSPHTLDIVFTDERFERRPGKVLGVPTYYQTAESLILAKLRMLKVTLNGERASTDREDIRSILQIVHVDSRFLRKKARVEGTIRILDELMAH
jgi:hypothetical protein